MSKVQVTLAQMEAGQAGVVVQIFGGHGLTRRLEVLGVRPGKRVTKISSMLLRGPVTFQVDSTQIAVGFGMANKIVVEVEKQ